MSKRSYRSARRKIRQAVLTQATNGDRGSRLAHICDWEGLAARSGYSPSGLARSCDVSLRHLERYFRDSYDLRLGSWLSDLRLWRALLTLRKNGHTVKEVAYTLGYKQCSHFSREFKKFHGVCPSSLHVLRARPDGAGLAVAIGSACGQLEFALG